MSRELGFFGDFGVDFDCDLGLFALVLILFLIAMSALFCWSLSFGWYGDILDLADLWSVMGPHRLPRGVGPRSTHVRPDTQ